MLRTAISVSPETARPAHPSGLRVAGNQPGRMPKPWYTSARPMTRWAERDRTPPPAAGPHSVHADFAFAAGVIPFASGARSRWARNSRCAPQVAQLDRVEDRYSSRWQPRWVLGVKVPNEGSRHGRHRRPRGHRALSRAAGPVVPPAHEKSAARAGKIAKRTARGVVSRHGLRPARTSRTCGKALSAKQLAIRAGRPGPQRRTAGRAGAPPPENGPRLYSGAFRRGRSRDLSLQEGRAATGPRRR